MLEASPSTYFVQKLLSKGFVARWGHPQSVWQVKSAQIIRHKKHCRLCPRAFISSPAAQHFCPHLHDPARPTPSSPTHLSSTSAPFFPRGHTKLLPQPAVNSNALLCSPPGSGEGREGQGTCFLRARSPSPCFFSATGDDFFNETDNKATKRVHSEAVAGCHGWERRGEIRKKKNT